MIDVTVINKLGARYGNKGLLVSKNEAPVGNGSISWTGSNNSVNLSGANALNEEDRLELEVQNPNGNYPQPVVRGPLNVGVSITPANDGTRWELRFHLVKVAKLDTLANKPGGANTTVTVGQDDPEFQLLFAFAVSLLTFIAGLVLGSFLRSASSLLWGGLIAVSAVGSFVTGFIGWRRRSKQKIEKGG